MLTKGYTRQVLNNFKNYIVKQSRANLTRGKKNFNKKLYDSIKGKVVEDNDSFSISFTMEDYGVYQDKGVKGVKSNYVENRNTPFSYKTSSNLLGVEAATGSLAKWAKHKGLKFRDVKGRYMSYKSIGFILARSIKNKGLKASFFFTKPFKKAYEDLDDRLIEAYGLDMIEFMEFSLKNIDFKTRKE